MKMYGAVGKGKWNKRQGSRFMEQDLLHFLIPTEEKLCVLTLESSHYLPQLRQLMPQAELYAVAVDADESREPAYAGLGVQWNVLDFRRERLPYPAEAFDYILADHYLESLVEPEDITAGLGYFVKSTGCLLTSFLNIRYSGMLDELRRGHFSAFCTHPLAKPEVVRILGVSMYKEVIFAPGRQDMPDAAIAAWEAAGFDNYQNDLSTQIWLVKACRSTAEGAALKALYSPAVRSRLAVLLRRIEYDIDPTDNLEAFWQLYEQEMLFSDYVVDFLMAASRHPAKLTALLAASAPPSQRSVQILFNELSAALRQSDSDRPSEVPAARVERQSF